MKFRIADVDTSETLADIEERLAPVELGQTTVALSELRQKALSNDVAHSGETMIPPDALRDGAILPAPSRSTPYRLGRTRRRLRCRRTLRMRRSRSRISIR
jgi:hypothetical protein